MTVRTVAVTVVLNIDEDKCEDLQTMLNEMDYNFEHPAILDMELVDINTEL